MGFNTSVVILNDALHVIKEHGQEFSEQLVNTILRQNINKVPTDVPCHNHCNVAQVILSQHADNTQLLAVGGNCGSVIETIYNGGRHHTPEFQVELLKRAAEKLGYKLIKKPSKAKT